jgi:FkbM family methyltransferase
MRGKLRRSLSRVVARLPLGTGAITEVWRLQDQVRALQATSELTLRLCAEGAGDGLRQALNQPVQFVLDDRGSILIFPRADSVIAPSIRTNGAWEIREEEWIRRQFHGRRDLVVLNVGANVGYFAVRLRDIWSRFLAVEPVRHLQTLMAANATLAGVSIELLAFAASDTNTEGFIELSTHNAGDNRVRGIGGDGVEPISLRRLSGFVDPGDVDLLIMDVQGFEAHALRGLLGESGARPLAILEYDPECLLEAGTPPEKFLEYIVEDLGYAIEVISPPLSDGPWSPESLAGEIDRRGWRTVSLGLVPSPALR